MKNKISVYLMACAFAFALSSIEQKAWADVEFEEFEEFEEEEFFEEEFIEEEEEEFFYEEEEEFVEEFVEDFVEEEEEEVILVPLEEENSCTLDTGTRFGILCDLWSAELSGRVATDALFLHKDRDGGFGDRGSAASMRATRLGVSGRIFNDFTYIFAYDFASRAPDGSRGQLEDASLSYHGIADNWALNLGNIRAAYTLNQATDSRFDVFMENSFADNAYGQSRPRYPGVSLSYGDEDNSAHFGAHYQAYNQDTDTGSSDVAVFGRFTFAPHDVEDDGFYSHFGFGGQYYNYNGGRVQDGDPLTIIAGSNPFTTSILSPNRDKDRIYRTSVTADSGGTPFSSRYIISSDIAFGKRPWGVQGGATRVTQEPDSITARSVDYYHFYGQVNWWFTRERNRYNPTTGSFDRIMPLKPLNQGGLGAIGFSTRFHRILLADGGSNTSGGNIWGFTAGVTWKPNPYVKFMGEYVYANRSTEACDNTGGTECAATGDAPRGVQFRALFDF